MHLCSIPPLEAGYFWQVICDRKFADFGNTEQLRLFPPFVGIMSSNLNQWDGTAFKPSA